MYLAIYKRCAVKALRLGCSAVLEIGPSNARLLKLNSSNQKGNSPLEICIGCVNDV